MIRLINVYKSYGSGGTGGNVLSGVNLDIKKGEFVFITGASGSGKTTLLKLLYGDERPTSGRILVDGQSVDSMKGCDIPYLRRKIGVVFQEFKLLQGRSVLDNVSVPLEVLGLPREETVKRVEDVLKTVKLHQKAEAAVSSLSGGEQQKVAVARAVINNPTIILADEPTGNLDEGSGGEIMSILRSVNSRGTTVLFATHNRSLVGGGRVVTIQKGRVLS